MVNQPKVSAIEIVPGTVPSAAQPAAPTGVAVTATGSGNAVTFAASPSSDVSGYYIERAAQADGTYLRLTSVPVSGSPYADTTAPATAGTVYYRVIAFSASGLSSAPSAPVGITRAATGSTVRINAGGPAVTTGGVSWLADSFYSGTGKSYTNPSVTQIAGTTNDVLYLNERSTTANLGAYSYDIPVPDGQYTVRLHFAEIYHGATGGGAGGTGKRVFSVNLEGGATEIVGLDLNARVAPMTAVVIENTVTVTGGNLDLDFSAAVDQPTLAAIEVVPVAAPAPPLTPPSTPGGTDTGTGAGAGAGAGTPPQTAAPSPTPGTTATPTTRALVPLGRVGSLTRGLVGMPTEASPSEAAAAGAPTTSTKSGSDVVSTIPTSPEANEEAHTEVLSTSTTPLALTAEDGYRAAGIVLLIMLLGTTAIIAVRRRWGAGRRPVD